MAIAICSSGMNAVPMPSPIRKNAPPIVGKNAVSGPVVVSSNSPAITATMPPTSTRMPPNRATRREVTPIDMIATVIVHGR